MKEKTVSEAIIKHTEESANVSQHVLSKIQYLPF